MGVQRGRPRDELPRWAIHLREYEAVAIKSDCTRVQGLRLRRVRLHFP